MPACLKCGYRFAHADTNSFPLIEAGHDYRELDPFLCWGERLQLLAWNFGRGDFSVETHRLATLQTAVLRGHHNTFAAVDTTLRMSSLNEPENVAVVIRPKTRVKCISPGGGSPGILSAPGCRASNTQSAGLKGIVGRVDNELQNQRGSTSLNPCSTGNRLMCRLLMWTAMIP